MVNINNLRNESYANEHLRFLSESEILLKVFHLYNNRMLQCLTKVEFVLNGHPTVCFELQAIELSQNFQIEYIKAKSCQRNTLQAIPT